jgi:hypothetical protein
VRGGRLRRSRLLKTGFFRQVRELKIQRKKMQAVLYVSPNSNAGALRPSLRPVRDEHQTLKCWSRTSHPFHPPVLLRPLPCLLTLLCLPCLKISAILNPKTVFICVCMSERCCKLLHCCGYSASAFSFFVFGQDFRAVALVSFCRYMLLGGAGVG